MDLQACADTLETALDDLRNGTGDPLAAIEDVASSLLDTEVWVLCINHADGDDLYVSSSLRAANAALVEYVDEWWDGEIRGQITRPDDNEERVAAYFDFVESIGEWYTLSSRALVVEKRVIITEAPEIDD